MGLTSIPPRIAQPFGVIMQRSICVLKEVASKFSRFIFKTSPCISWIKVVYSLKVTSMCSQEIDSSHFIKDGGSSLDAFFLQKQRPCWHQWWDLVHSIRGLRPSFQWLLEVQIRSCTWLKCLIYTTFKMIECKCGIW